MQHSHAKYSGAKKITIALLIILTLIFTSLGAIKLLPAKNVSAASYTKIAHYEFNGASSLGVDSTGNNNLTNSGVTYDETLNAAEFGTTGILYATKDDSGKDFSDNISGSYSISMRIYAKQTGGGAHWICNTGNWDAGASIAWAYRGTQMLLPTGVGNDIMDDGGVESGTDMFSITEAWYRLTYIYDASTGILTATSIKEGDSSYSFTVTKNVGTTFNFGGNVDTVVNGETVPGYTFTIGGKSAAGVNASDYMSDGSWAPKISDFRIYTGVIDQTEMDAIAQYDLTEGSKKASLVAHYEFEDSANLGKDSTGANNLTNSGVTYNANKYAADFSATNAVLYATKDGAGKDFSDYITGSYSISMRIYAAVPTTNTSNKWICNTGNWDAGASIAWAYRGTQMLLPDGVGNDIMDNGGQESGTDMFSATQAWYRLTYIYDASTGILTATSIKEGDSSYSFTVTKNVGTTFNFGGNVDTVVNGETVPGYTFTIGGKSSAGANIADTLSGSTPTPLISNFRIYQGAIDQTEMQAILDYDAQKAVSRQNPIELPFLFQDGMVLQREKKVEIYGSAKPTTEVTVKFNGQTKSGMSDANGDFSIYLDEMTANATGQNLTIETSYETKTISNVVVGEVYMGLGQSNMAYPIFEFTYAEGVIKGNTSDADYPKYTASDYKAIQDSLNTYSNYSKLRFVNVYNNGFNDWQHKNTVQWNRWITPVNDANSTEAVQKISFTAVAYALQLQQKLSELEGQDVPVAVVVSALGGSRIRQWIDPAERTTGGVAEGLSPTDAAVGEHFALGIAPILRYNCRGVLWYQGESDVYHCSPEENYKEQVKWLINEFKEKQNDQDIHSLIYQLPQYVNNEYWMNMRMFHKDIADTNPNTHLVSAIDTGDDTNIHPTDKFEFNARAVGVALKEIYGLAYSGSGYYGEAPVAISAIKQGSTVTINFDSATTALTLASGNKAPLYLSNNPITFANNSTIVNGWDSTTTNYTVSGNTITLTTDYKYISFAVENTYANDLVWVKNQYGLVMAPFINVEVLDNAITLDVNNGANGSVTVNGSAPAQSYTKDTTLNFVITPNEGYKVATAKWNGQDLTEFNSAGFTFSKTASENASLVVTYEIITFTSSVTFDSLKGSVTGITNGDTLNYNQAVNIVITPLTGNVIKSVTLNGAPVTENFNKAGFTVNYTATQNLILEVVFAKDVYNVTVNNGNNNGTVTGITAGEHENGTQFTVTITPSTGYKILSAKWNGIDITEFNSAGFTFTKTLTENGTLSIVYEKQAFNTYLQNTTLGQVSGFNESIYEYGAILTVTITPNNGCAIESVKVNNQPIDITDVFGFTFNVTITQETTLFVSYTQITYSVAVTFDQEKGSVIGVKNNYDYQANTSLNITIQAKAGYKISSIKWNGVNETVSNKTTVVLSKTLTDNATLDVKFVVDRSQQEEQPASTESSGCGASLSVGGTAILGAVALLTAGVITLKKKKDN